MEQQIDWKNLLDEMEKLLKDNTNTETQSQEQQQTSLPAQTKAQGELTEEEQRQIENYVNNTIQMGRQIFISKYGSMPNFSKYFHYIDTLAYNNFMNDLSTKGQTKGSYDLYLEEALRNFLSELYSASKDFMTVADALKSQEAKPQTVQKPYTLQDYYDDYKKALEKITLKNMAHVFYKDGSKHRGVWGEPQLELDKQVSLDDI